MNSGMLRTLFRPGRNATDRGLATVADITENEKSTFFSRFLYKK